MRLCEYVGIPSQFQGRVDGVGSQRPGDPGPYGDIMADLVKGQRACIGPDCQMDGGSRLAVCHSNSPPGTCKPVDWNPLAEAPRDEAPREKLAAKSSGLPLPILLGAAYLLLS